MNVLVLMKDSALQIFSGTKDTHQALIFSQSSLKHKQPVQACMLFDSMLLPGMNHVRWRDSVQNSVI